MSHSFKHFKQIAVRMQPDDPLAKFAPPQNFRRQVFRDQNPLARAHFLARPNQRFPSVCSNLPRQKDLNAAGSLFPPAIQSRRKNPRVVQHKAIVLMHIGRKVPKHAIFPGAGGAVDHQHPSPVAFGKWLLRNQFFGQIIIKLINTHSSRLILGIESSCDETAAAVVEDGTRILTSVVASQMETHAKYGGVVPELASREHLRAIVPVVRTGDWNREQTHLDAIAVTEGPGLIGSLLVGITYAKALAKARGIPLISVNHIEGHIYAVSSQNAVGASGARAGGQRRAHAPL